MNWRGARASIGLAGALAAVVAPAAPIAAQAVAPPPPADVIRQQLPSREEVTPPTPGRTPSASAAIDAKGALAQPACPFEGSPETLTIDRLELVRPDGTPLAAPIAATLAPIRAPSGPQPLKVICRLRDDANAALRRAGWIASVSIPPQSIRSGTLRLIVVTARIVDVRVRGNPGPYRRVLARRIAALKRLDPLNQREAERLLLLANDVPGLTVQLSLRPAGTVRGEVIGDLAVSYRRFAVLANVQDYNSGTLGRYTAYLRAEVYGLTGMSDITYVGGSSTLGVDRQQIVQVGHVAGVGWGGTTVGGEFTYAWSRPKLGDLDFRTNTLIGGINIVKPLLRTVNGNLRASTGFSLVDQDSRIDSQGTSTPLNRDRIRTAYARLSGDWLRRRSDGGVGISLRGGIEVRKGLDILDSTPVGSTAGGVIPSRIDGDSRALVLRADADMLASLDRIFSVAAQVRGQWANHALLNYDEFSIGNLTIGRGYDPGANSGDRAIGTRGELRADLPVARVVAPQVFGFFDYVWLTNLDAFSTERNRSFRSTGGGIRLTLENRALVELFYARPLDRALLSDTRKPPGRVLFSITTQLRGRAT